MPVHARLCRDPAAKGVLDWLHRHAPTWLTHMPGLVGGAELEALRRRLPEATQDRMLREMDEAVEALTAERPLVLVLEDLHWSDHATLDLIVWLARRREPARLLLLGTYRPVDVIVGGHPMRAVARELRLHQRCEEMSLELLGEADVAQHLAIRFPGGRLSSELARAIHRRTDGNPLFMVAVVDALVRQGWIALVDDRWEAKPGAADAAMQVPPTLREMVEQRLEDLAPELRRLLESASVAGPEFSAAAVAGGLEADPAAVDEQCAELARRGQFLQAAGVETWPDETEAGRFRFVHALYQHVIYEAIRPGRRRELHRRIGTRIESGYIARPERSAELARHFLEGRDAARAVTHLSHAARSALGRSAYHEAIACLCQGLEALQRLPDTAERAQQELDFRIALGPPLMAVRGIASAVVGEAYTRARELCQRMADSPHVFWATWGLAVHYLVRGQVQIAREQADRLLGLAAEAPHPTHASLAHMAAGNTLYYLGEMTLAREHLDQAVSLSGSGSGRTLAIQGGQEDPAVTPILRLAWVLWAQGFPDQAVERCLGALELARESSHSATMTAALVYLARLFQFRREPDRAREHAEAALARASEQGFAQRLAAAQILLGWARTELGVEEGFESMTRGIDDFRSTGAGDDLPYWLALRAAARGKVGQVDAALDDVAQGLEIVSGGGARVWEAELHRIRGELILRGNGSARRASRPAAGPALEAEACFQRALAIARRQQARSLELRATVSLAWLWREAGRPADARDLLLPAYAWFTEGLDGADLVEARALLELLSGITRSRARGCGTGGAPGSPPGGS